MPRRSRSPSPSGGRRGFSSSSSSSGSSSKTKTAERSSAPPPAPARQTQPAPAPQHHAPPQQAPVMGGGGGSFLGRVAELGAGIAVGHVAGRALENVFFGGRDASPQQLEKAEEAVRQGPCSQQYDTFIRCLQRNENDASQCDWVLDMFKECQMTDRKTRERVSSSNWGDDYKEQESTL